MLRWRRLFEPCLFEHSTSDTVKSFGSIQSWSVWSSMVKAGLLNACVYVTLVLAREFELSLRRQKYFPVYTIFH